MGHKDRYVGSLVYRESVVLVPMILLFKSFLDQIGATSQPTKDSYDRVDYYFQIKGKKYVAEIKVRNAFYDDYLIEADKL